MTFPISPEPPPGGGGGGTGPELSNVAAADLGVGASGSSPKASRADHIHDMPSSTDVGAAAASHTHVTTDVTGFDERVRDVIGAALVAGSNVTVTVDDTADSITIASSGGGGSAYTDEQVRDVIGTALVAGSNVTVTVNDAGDTITITATGNVVGPASATDSVPAMFDGTTGKLLKNGTALGTAAYTASSSYATSGHNHTGVYDPAGTAAGLVDDLSGVTNAATARANLGLGDAATKNVGTTAGTVMAGDTAIPAAFTAEDARDTIGAALVAGSNIGITVDDAANSITIAASGGTAYTDEQVRDTMASALVAGTNIIITPNDGADTITIDATVSGGGGGDVVGPAGATDGRAVLFDGVTGKLIKQASAAPQLVGDAPTAHTHDNVANVATSTILGRVTAGSGNSEELTAAQARTVMELGTAATADAATFAGSGHNHTGVYDPAGTAAALVDDLSGVSNATTARTNLGLGDSATKNTGTTAGTVMAGDTTIPAAYTDEQVRDVIGAALVAGSGITVTPNDGADSITIAATGGYTDEQVRDVMGTALVAGSNITITPNDGADTITITSTGGGASVPPVDAASTGNVTRSGTQTIDGVALIAGDKVLLKDQTTPAENGVYTVAAGAWTLDTAYTDTYFVVRGGTVNEGAIFSDQPTGAPQGIIGPQGPAGPAGADGANGSEPLPIVFAADHGVDAANSATANGTAMRLLAATYPGRHIQLPIGTIEVDAVLGDAYTADGHPLDLTDATYPAHACMWLQTDTWLEIPLGCNIKYMGNSSTHGVLGTVPSGVVRLFSNENMSTGGDSGIRIFGGGTINGNTAAFLAGSGGTLGAFLGASIAFRRNVGIAFWRASQCSVDGLTIKDFHGEGGGDGENFLVDAIRCMDIKYTNVRCLNTIQDGNSVSTGFSNTYGFHINYSGCVAEGMDVQGFTSYGSRNLTFEQCAARRNKRGFNYEYCWDATATDCIAGGIGPRYPKATSGSASGNGDFTDGDVTYGNDEGGFHVLFGGGTTGNGGGNYKFVNCTSSGQLGASGRGWAFSGTHYFTATTGTTGTSVVATSADYVSRALIGGHIQVGSGNPLVRVTAVSGTTITTATAHGGASGNTVLYYPGPIELIGCNLVENYRGIQFLGPNNHPVSRSVTLRDCTFTGNTNVDIQDAARSDSTSTSITDIDRGTDVTANITLPVDGTPFLNPMPFDVLLHVSGASAVEKAPRTISNVATRVAFPLPGDPSQTIVRNADTGLLTGTTLATDAILQLTLVPLPATGKWFVVEGEIVYTGNTTNDAQFTLQLTQASSSQPQMASTFLAQDATRLLSDGADASTFPITAGTLPFERRWEDYQSAPTPTTTPLETSPVVAGVNSTTRKTMSFKSTVFMPGGVNGVFAIRYAEATAVDGASTGLNVRAPSWIRATPIDGGSITGGTGAANVTVPWAAGEWIAVTASSYEAVVA